jgi:hypothetical protein
MRSQQFAELAESDPIACSKLLAAWEAATIAAVRLGQCP